MQRITTWVLAVVLAALSFTASAGPELEDWLVKMTAATRTSNYRGTLMYRSGDMMETMQIVHRFLDGELRERIFSTSGDPREILRRNDEVTCIIPRERKVTIDKFGAEGFFPELKRATLEKLRAHYELSDLGETRVAGRQCQGIQIAPRDQYRYGYRIWIDAETAVPVKLSLIGQGGEVLEQVAFTNVEFPEAIEDQHLVPHLDHQGYDFVTHRMLPKEQGGTSAWITDTMPPGFELMQRVVRSVPGGDQTVEHLMLSDGLSSVSIYSSTMPENDGMYEGPSGMGAVNTYARLVSNHHLTVVGEVPAQTVRLIATGLRLAVPAAP